MHFAVPSTFPFTSLVLAFLLAASLPQPASALPSGPPGFFGAAYNPASSMTNLTTTDSTYYRPTSRGPAPDLTKRAFERPRFAREAPNPLVERGTPSCCGTFKLAQSYAGSTFLDGFDFFTGADPTHGQVAYTTRDEAVAKGLTYTDENGATVLRVDSWTSLPAGAGRDSVRIESKQTIGIGSLVVLDASKIPWGPSVWGAFWTVGQDWPNGGEIDILEGVHNNSQNQATLHTSPGCTLTTPMQATGKVLGTDCNVYANGNTGCGVQDPSPTSYGPGFAGVGGGVSAMHWDKHAISAWSFPRSAIPADLLADTPNPSSWPAPAARWDATGCDMAKSFGPQNIIFDITTCGDWAGATYNSAGFAGTCSDAVMDPANFVNAQFVINSLKVYVPQA